MQRIGLLSDSHGNAQATQAAARMLAENRADLLLHMGDIGTTEVIDALLVPHPDTGKTIDCRIVFGNTDWDITTLHRHATRLGIMVDHPAGQFNVNGKSIMFTHGDQSQINQRALKDNINYFCHGHTHKLSDTLMGQTRVINPGALFRAPRYTIAMLDIDADQVEFHDISK